jgi:hypothetical protein
MKVDYTAQYPTGGKTVYDVDVRDVPPSTATVHVTVCGPTQAVSDEEFSAAAAASHRAARAVGFKFE